MQYIYVRERSFHLEIGVEIYFFASTNCYFGFDYNRCDGNVEMKINIYMGRSFSNQLKALSTFFNHRRVLCMIAFERQKSLIFNPEALEGGM